ncbi:uncharacterized protein LOC113517353 [Galleria mellonella]|uniref:Uncharacterized protein LOC113517353 n=1 Tax=Galleria mellonella TaxID=7137 RepID=A0ABM3N1Q9_GALME|nr:uncharacterized protein LOC113517353 [Galleria mellonella]XP_052757405.1 uncharacterized protein LOC113517353 [Galleria mellonella]
MEADSTTYENNSKTAQDDDSFPFSVCPGNFKLYKEFTCNNGEKHLESQIVERLQNFGLLPRTVQCPAALPECKVVCKTARVIDKVQWVCQGCGKKQPIRMGSFFLKLQCSILQTLQMVLAWCEDADCDVAAEYFKVKPKIANHIYDRLEELAVLEQSKYILGGENAVVLAEMYPDCLNRLSPDTTDQPHVHRILMLADTNHIPTHYQLHVIKEDLKKNSVSSLDNQSLTAEIEAVVSRVTSPQSLLVSGSSVPQLAGACSVQQLLQHCDPDMQHFLSTRIWRQAVSLCAASRDFCSEAASSGSTGACATFVQRYLHAALYRLKHDDGFYHHLLTVIANQYTDK